MEHEITLPILHIFNRVVGFNALRAVAWQVELFVLRADAPILIVGLIKD